ncbi:uncharacterized protein LOC125233658 [Leguminivora glycinivorella]|uniref:uncharacterized protein LOC125233658 n=1 Tax=Leguminivora glycinivorella TaxID=1035111 RepID=UPI00200C1EAD|nr:uncharacterized protein LOC125233658 [Leguminivora glycinivorella]
MWLKIVLLVFSVTTSSSLDVGGVISGNRMGAIPLGVSLSEGELDVEGICSEQGVACLNCSMAIKCVILPVGWLKIPLESCGAGTTCNARHGGCSKQHVPECDLATDEYQHSCEQIGIFPDAHDCRKFHICSPPEGSLDGKPADHRSSLCPRHYGYNPATAQCSIPLNNGQCETRPVPKCTKIGETGVLSSSPNHYYVCRSKNWHLKPQIFLCPHGWMFVDGFCQPGLSQNTNAVSTLRSLGFADAESGVHRFQGLAYNDNNESVSTEKPTTSSVYMALFSTEKTSTYTPDTFLADKFDLSNYDVFDDGQRTSDSNSWESSNVSW